MTIFVGTHAGSRINRLNGVIKGSELAIEASRNVAFRAFKNMVTAEVKTV
ncbi:Uncharacterised protein [Vibrio cholerae]|nr:Uncharacterised protein [Vibrio cholerae]